MENLTTMIYAAYSVQHDMSFIMCDTYNKGNLVSIECIGWYFGEPVEASTEKFIGKLKAEY